MRYIRLERPQSYLDLMEQKAAAEAAAAQRSCLSKTYGGGPVYHEYPMNVKNS
jgi:hypothetical protein